MVLFAQPCSRFHFFVRVECDKETNPAKMCTFSDAHEFGLAYDGFKRKRASTFSNYKGWTEKWVMSCPKEKPLMQVIAVIILIKVTKECKSMDLFSAHIHSQVCL